MKFKSDKKYFITEDDIADWVYDNNGLLLTRKYNTFRNPNYDAKYVCLNGYSKTIKIFCTTQLRRLKNPIILILIEADVIKIPNVLLQSNKVIKIFTWNKYVNHYKVHCIPIGLNKDRMLSVIENTPKDIQKEKLVLINFSVSSDPIRKKITENKELMEISENIPYMKPDKSYSRKSYVDGSIGIDVTNKDYYTEMGKFKFVVSPRGGGEDCHRTWEALYMGSIPIVSSSSINELYDDLPVLVVDDWNCITKEFLEEKWEEFKDKKWNLNKLDINYWFNKFSYFKYTINFITYGNDVFYQAKNRLVKEAQNFYNFKSITSYGPEDLDKDFKKKYHDVLSQKRIGGYGIWRPYIIKKELEKVENNDFLIYCDAGCTLNPKGMKRFQEYLEILKNSNYGIISFQMHNQIEKWWTTKEIFNYFEVDIESKIGNSGQYLDGILIMKKNEHLIKIVDLWMKAVHEKSEIFTDKFNKFNQHSFFKDNRHEQSVLSLIRKIYGSEIIPKDETYFTNFGRGESLRYPIWATRMK